MNIRETYRAIRQGNITDSVVSTILRQDFPLTPEYALMAAAPLIKSDPSTAKLILRRIDLEDLAAAVRAGRIAPHLVNLSAKIWRRSKPLRSAILESPLAPTEALLNILPALDDGQINSLVKDEVRLVLAPSVVTALLEDPRVDEEGKQSLEQLHQRIKEDEQLSLREEFLPENLDEEGQSLLLDSEKPDEEEEEDIAAEDETNIYTMLKKMTIAERAMLTMKANKTVRMLLVKDSNRLVARSVLRSPRLTEQDVESIAKVREVDEEILRSISTNKRWMRNYSVTKNLAFNPRTPLAISMSLTERLSNADIRSGSRDHNIPIALRQFISKVAQKRGIR